MTLTRQATARAASQALVARVPRVLLIVIAVVATAGWLFLAAVHLDDRYRVGHVQGAWMGLAQSADGGVLYPPLYDGEHYGGTRYMPLPIIVNAAAARLTGEYLISGKLVALGLMTMLLGLLFACLRARGAPVALAATLAASVVATEVGLQAGTTVGGDVLPALLQLGAIAVAARASPRSTVVAAVLAALAVASKLTGVWAALAIVCWLVVRDRRAAARFVLVFATVAVAVLGLAELLSGGRMSENLATLAFGSETGPLAFARAPNQLLYRLVEFAPGVWALMPLAAASILLALTARQLDLYQIAWGFSLLLVLVTFTDVGTDFNQLLDLMLLTAVLVADLAVRSREGSVAVLVTLATGWAIVTGIAITVLPDVREAVTDGAVEQRAPLTHAVEPGDALLSEDPSLPVTLGRPPTVLDPFMLLRIDRVRPDAVNDLIGRIDRREFDIIALVVELDADEQWWTDYHLGPRVVDAIRRSYAASGQIDGYFVYRPRPD
jgi:hypothetical protein